METVIEAIQGICRNRIFSVIAGAVVFVSSLMLGVFIVSLLNVNAFIGNVGEQVVIEAYLRQGTTDEKGQFLARAAGTIKGVDTAKFIPSAEAAARLGGNEGTANLLSDMEIMGFVPSSIEVSVDDPKYIQLVANALLDYEGVESVRHGDDAAAKALVLASAVKQLCWILFVMLILSTIAVISAVTAMTVASERENIEVLKLLGAEDFFIMRPYIYEGAIVGGLGSFLAAFVLRVGYGSVATPSVSVLSLVPAYPTVYLAGVMMIIFGVAFGGIGACAATKHFLKGEV